MASLRVATFGCLLVTASALPAAAQAAPPSIEQVLDTVTAAETFRGVALSPDGARGAWVGAARERDGRPTKASAVFRADPAPAGGGAGTPPRQVPPHPPNPADTAANLRIAESDPAWSAD